MSMGDLEHFNNGQMLATKWRDKRDVHVLSIVHSGTMVLTGKVDYATGRNVSKPCCVLAYNSKMGSVDNLDRRNTFVECAQKTIKWYRKLFFYVLDVAVFNSYVVHRQLTGHTVKNLTCKIVE